MITTAQERDKVNKVVCLRTGDKYGPEYADRLYSGLKQHTTKPFAFQILMQASQPGWWGKLDIFEPARRTIYLDLDVVITGNVDFLFEYDGPFCAWKDPWASGLNSSVMSIAPGFGKELKRLFCHDPARQMRLYRSDQEYLRDVTVPDYWQDGLIQSYKADRLQESPGDARIVVFHGQPKPHELPGGHWIGEFWR